MLDAPFDISKISRRYGFANSDTVPRLVFDPVATQEMHESLCGNTTIPPSGLLTTHYTFTFNRQIHHRQGCSLSTLDDSSWPCLCQAGQLRSLPPANRRRKANSKSYRGMKGKVLAAYSGAAGVSRHPSGDMPNVERRKTSRRTRLKV